MSCNLTRDNESIKNCKSKEVVYFFLLQFVKFRPDNPKTMVRGGYDRTLFITEDTEKVPNEKEEFRQHFEKLDLNTKL